MRLLFAVLGFIFTFLFLLPCFSCLCLIMCLFALFFHFQGVNKYFQHRTLADAKRLCGVLPYVSLHSRSPACLLHSSGFILFSGGPELPVVESALASDVKPVILPDNYDPREKYGAIWLDPFLF